MLRYALFAATLPGGHFFQDRISDVSGYAELTRFDDLDPGCRQPVREPGRHGREGRERDGARQEGQDQGAAAAADDGDRAEREQRRRLGRERELSARPARLPDGAAAERAGAERADVRPTSTRRSTSTRSRRARRRRPPSLQKLLQPADVRPLPKRSSRAEGARSGLDAARDRRPDLPQHLATAPSTVVVPKRQPANVRFDRGPGDELLTPLVKTVPFRLEVPTILERVSNPDTLPSDKPVTALLDRGPQAQGGAAGVPHRRRTSSGESRRPTGPTRRCSPTGASSTISAVASSRSTTRARISTWSCCASHDASYWVVNTLLDSLSNETMLAIAKGLKPLTTGK